MIRVIGLQAHQLITLDLRRPPRRCDGCCVSDTERDVLKLAVIERHRGSGNIGLGFVHGFGLRRGALASTIAHDSHNLTLLGVCDRDMIVAARALARVGGGQCVSCDGEVRALLPLPVAGLLSEEPVERLVAQQRAVLDAAAALGCTLTDPFMPLSFLSLTVIPHLPLSDRGLADVDRLAIVPLEAPEP
jgi:adenine deaminase